MEQKGVMCVNYVLSNNKQVILTDAVCCRLTNKELGDTTYKDISQTNETISIK